ncbi:hypothetical protein D3C80_1230060 [compost metagenome]
MASFTAAAARTSNSGGTKPKPSAPLATSRSTMAASATALSLKVMESWKPPSSGQICGQPPFGYWALSR